MIPLAILSTLILTGLLYVLSQHGFGNTLLSIGMWFYDAGVRFNQRTDERRVVVIRQWTQRLGRAE